MGLKKLLIGVLLFSSGVSANHNTLDDWKFDHHQIQTLKRAYSSGTNTQHGGILYSAIVWQESGAGKWKENKHSVGNFHNLITTVYNREKQHGKIYSRNQIKHKLMTDFNFEVKHATAQLDGCKKQLKVKTTRNILACYNGGFGGYRGKQAQHYASQVLAKIENLRKRNVL